MHRAAARGSWNAAWNNGVPSIPEMGKALYHYWMGTPALGGNSEASISPNIGIAPDMTPGKKAKAAGKAANALRSNAEKAKELYNKLSSAEQRNFDVFLKNGNTTLDKISDSDLWELRRLVEGNFKPSMGNDVGVDRSIRSTDQWFDYTKIH